MNVCLLLTALDRIFLANATVPVIEILLAVNGFAIVAGLISTRIFALLIGMSHTPAETAISTWVAIGFITIQWLFIAYFAKTAAGWIRPLKDG